jgi:hypothetical protein
MDLKEAKRLALLKWEFLANTEEQIPKDYFIRMKWIEKNVPELRELREYAYCSFCSLYYRGMCEECPVRIEIGGELVNCLNTNHPFSQYRNSSENAKKVLEIIKNIKV